MENKAPEFITMVLNMDRHNNEKISMQNMIESHLNKISHLELEIRVKGEQLKKAKEKVT